MDYLELAIKIGGMIIQLEQDLQPFLVEAYAAMTKPGGPTKADIAILKAKEDSLSNEIQAPLPDDS